MLPEAGYAVGKSRLDVLIACVSKRFRALTGVLTRYPKR